MKNNEAEENNLDNKEYRLTNYSLHLEQIPIEINRRLSNKQVKNEIYKNDIELNKIERLESSPRKIDYDNSVAKLMPRQNDIEKKLPSGEDCYKKKYKNEKFENDDIVQMNFPKEGKNENNLIFTFKEKEKEKTNSKDKPSSDNAYILETEQNIKLFERKYQEFQKNSMLNSSFQNEVNSNIMTKFDEPNYNYN